MEKHEIYCLIETTEISSNSSSSELSSSEISNFSKEDSSTDNEDDNDALFFPLIRYLTSGHKKQKVKNYLRIVASWTNSEFKEHLRLSRRTTYQLIDELEQSSYIPCHSFGMRPISVELSFIIFLWFLSNTEPLRTIADRFDISISSVFRVIRRVLAWILTKIYIIKWPQGNEIQTVCNQFFLKRGIPKVLGAIDCTHIRIKKPTENESDYCNRKKYFSVNLQAVVDPQMRFINIYCGEPGSLHDARVLRRSPLYNTANDNRDMLFPQNTFIIGDSAYPSLSWLVPPFRDNGHLTPQQTEFNTMLSSTRIKIEQAFGYLKGRFRRLKFFTEYKHINFVTDIITAGCILHNYCINENDDFSCIDEQYDDFINDEPDNINENVGNRVTIDRRRELFNELFS
ncbi:PREDICTED: putative nuclease HARBI1 [Cyphomyrmex costatus]|uniref:putative nuclease HARBI1 n=1 Tax=Cyphomyrmex costatus TaxID=456900 RepID=UPI00085235B5|nr:PREDICTED: putative nuclease HARBI1 [Cyphomyrmex costatus]XP_018406053.1 PREDICTED: putative nuclease HARBI1 [Cyphomyrmex costatus]